MILSELINRTEKKHKIPSGLLFSLIESESGFRENARGKDGEIGLVQIMPKTAREDLGFSGTDKELENPETNIEYGGRYLAYTLSVARQRVSGEENIIRHALAGYNGGPSKIGKDYSNKDYVRRVYTRYRITSALADMNKLLPLFFGVVALNLIKEGKNLFGKEE